MSNIKIRKGLFDTQLELEHAAVMAGFPSPADDYRHDTLDFNKDYILATVASPQLFCDKQNPKSRQHLYIIRSIPK